MKGNVCDQKYCMLYPLRSQAALTSTVCNDILYLGWKNKKKFVYRTGKVNEKETSMSLKVCPGQSPDPDRVHEFKEGPNISLKQWSRNLYRRARVEESAEGKKHHNTEE